MEYRKLVIVTGLTGLHELVGAKKDGSIVRSLDDKSTRFVASRVHNVSHLETVEVYTVHDNVSLAEVFLAMQNSSEPLPAEKDAAAVKAYFQNVYPDIDFERVYASDMKKMVKWYASLKANDVEIKLAPAEDEPAVEDEPAATAEEVAEPLGEAKDENKAGFGLPVLLIKNAFLGDRQFIIIQHRCVTHLYGITLQQQKAASQNIIHFY